MNETCMDDAISQPKPNHLAHSTHHHLNRYFALVFCCLRKLSRKTCTHWDFVVLFLFFGNAMPSILLCMLAIRLNKQWISIAFSYFLGPQDTSVFLREYLNGWYSMPAYYASKIVADLPMQLVCPTMLIGIVCCMTGQPQEMPRLVMCWIIAVIIAFIGHFFGLSFGSMFNLQVRI